MTTPTEVRTWRCIFCLALLERQTIAERYDHCIDEHLAELKHANAKTLALIVTPR